MTKQKTVLKHEQNGCIAILQMLKAVDFSQIFYLRTRQTTFSKAKPLTGLKVLQQVEIISPKTRLSNNIFCQAVNRRIWLRADQCCSRRRISLIPFTSMSCLTIHTRTAIEVRNVKKHKIKLFACAAARLFKQQP